MSNDKNVKFNAASLGLLNSLCTISPSVLFEKNEDKSKLLVNRTNASTSIAYKMEMPIEHFEFHGDELALVNFSEFHAMLKVFSQAKISQVNDGNHEKFILTEGKKKIKYLISDADAVKKGPGNIPWKESVFAVTLKSGDLKELVKAIGLVQASKVNFSVEPDQDLTVKLFKDETDNSFEQVFAPDKVTEKVNLTVESELFVLLPEGDYVFEVTSQGLVRLTYIHDEIKLHIFTAEVEEG